MEGTYNWGLVALSYAVSVLGALTALQLAIGIPLARRGVPRILAVLAAAIAMGGGAVWSMHFIAMLAYQMPVPVSYDTGLTLLSAVVAVISCAVGLAVVGLGIFTPGRLVGGGVFMGIGVSGMHYTGMAAMLMPATIHYSVTLVAVSVLIGIAASIAALWLAFHLRGGWQMLGSAPVMGGAVCGMHYTGMVATGFSASGEAMTPGALGAMGGQNLGETIFLITAVLLGVVLILSYARHQRRQAVSI